MKTERGGKHYEAHRNRQVEAHHSMVLPYDGQRDHWVVNISWLIAARATFVGGTASSLTGAKQESDQVNPAEPAREVPSAPASEAGR